MIEMVAFVLATVGILLLINLMPARFSLKDSFSSLAKSLDKGSNRGADKTAQDYVNRLNGVDKENVLSKAYREAREIYVTIGQKDRYQTILQVALFSGIAGFAFGGMVMKNWGLAVVLGAGTYLIPMWGTQFALFRYERYLSDELETSLSLITTSYLRCNDILAAVEENLSHTNNPVKSSFISFCNRLKYVDPNAPAALERLKHSMDHAIFHQWCDILILCQENHLQQAALPGIVEKFSELKAQQESNETRMMMPLRQAILMIGMVVSVVVLLYLIYRPWFDYLIETAFGQVSLIFMAVAVILTINRAIKLSRPISYDV